MEHTIENYNAILPQQVNHLSFSNIDVILVFRNSVFLATKLKISWVNVTQHWTQNQSTYIILGPWLPKISSVIGTPNLQQISNTVLQYGLLTHHLHH